MFIAGMLKSCNLFYYFYGMSMSYMKLLPFLGFSLYFLFASYTVAGETEFFNNNANLIKAKLDNSSLGVPIFIQSNDGEKKVSAEVYGKLSYTFGEVQNALSSPANWCEIVTLNLNIKACTHRSNHKPIGLDVYVGGKEYETPEDAYVLNYQYHLEKNTQDTISILLAANEGPMSTSNHRIELQAIPAQNGTYLRIRTSYEPSFYSRIATSTYLKTLGRNKIGFSVVANGENGDPRYVKGIKGVIERNVMRYYLATVAFLDTRDLPQADQFRTRSLRWFNLTEQFVRQLHEMERTEYLNTKQLERRNQYILQARLNDNTNISLKNQSM